MDANYLYLIKSYMNFDTIGYHTVFLMGCFDVDVLHSYQQLGLGVVQMRMEKLHSMLLS